MTNILAAAVLSLTTAAAIEIPGAFRQPQLAASPDGRLLAATFGSGNQIYFSASTDGGATFTPPVAVNSAGAGGVFALGRHRGPRIAVTSRVIVITAIAGEKGGGRDGDVLAWRSTDRGKTWSSQPVRVNSIAGSAREGLHSMAAGRDGSLFAAWLDLRSKGTTLHGASSNDGGLTWSANTLLYASPDGHICECCHPTVAFDAADAPVVMFRNWLAGSRDMYVVNGRTGKAAKLGEGTWPLNACPMDGGGLALAGSTLLAAWRRDGVIYWNEAESKEVEAGKGKDPAIAYSASRKAPVVVWQAPEGLRTTTAVLDPKGSYASLTTAGPGGAVYAAWETEGGIRVQKLVP